MRNELQKLDARRDCITIAVAILETDIEEMWNRFDSGMCDLTTGNAVALAINRTLRPDRNIRVASDGSEEEFHCLFGEELVSLPTEVSTWLSRCLRGIPEEPIHFDLSLPRHLTVDWGGIVLSVVETEDDPIAA